MRPISRAWQRIVFAGTILLIPSAAFVSAAKYLGHSRPDENVPAQSTTAPPAPTNPSANAWIILRAATADTNADRRAKAVSALGLVTRNADAEDLVRAALKDDKPEVRKAAAGALGRMGTPNAKDDLHNAMNDAEPAVALAAANALLSLKDDDGYSVYYEVLTGARKGGKGPVGSELDTLKNTKKLAQMGFEEGIGFVPFASIGYEVIKTLTKDDVSPVRAGAARKLASDPDPESGKALVAAAEDKNWLIRAASLEALAIRSDASVLPKITALLEDSKDEVKFTAAACVIHLSGLPAKQHRRR